MFDPTSRYYEIDDAVAMLPDGREIAFKRRRFVPRAADLQPIGEETVGAADRLDLVAARGLGDPEQFWRVCDANGALDPADLLQPGRKLTIPMPTPGA